MSKDHILYNLTDITPLGEAVREKEDRSVVARDKGTGRRAVAVGVKRNTDDACDHSCFLSEDWWFMVTRKWLHMTLTDTLPLPFSGWETELRLWQMVSKWKLNARQRNLFVLFLTFACESLSQNNMLFKVLNKILKHWNSEIYNSTVPEHKHVILECLLVNQSIQSASQWISAPSSLWTLGFSSMTNSCRSLACLTTVCFFGLRTHSLHF